ncbi:MAG: iron-containing alcohol dehydrogenase [Pseudomonadota bacterium]
MTLINYLTRIHFADGVLEEALHSEMDAHHKTRPLIIAEDGHLSGVVAERFFTSFPIRTVAETYAAAPAQATEAAALEIAEIYRSSNCDLLIAFGSNRAMDLAKVARVAIGHQEPLAALSNDEGGAYRIGKDLPDLYSIPGILGFASAISDYTRVRLNEGRQVLISSRQLIPTVTICDPTLTLGASRAESAIAAAGILARAIDSYLSPAYNPPAEGLALDALTRVTDNLGLVMNDDNLPARREMMAGGLNSSMSLQKGLCVVHAISNAVASIAPEPVDPSTLGGILIPELVAFYGSQPDRRLEHLKRCLNIEPSRDLAHGIRAITHPLPLPKNLAQLGVRQINLERAAKLAVMDRAIGNGPCRLTVGSVEEILNSAFDAGSISAKTRTNHDTVA